MRWLERWRIAIRAWSLLIQGKSVLQLDYEVSDGQATDAD